MREHYPYLFAVLLVAGTGLLAGCVMGTLVALLDEFTQNPREFVRVIRRSFPMYCNNCDRWILHRFTANLGLPYCTGCDALNERMIFRKRNRLHIPSNVSVSVRNEMVEAQVMKLQRERRRVVGLSSARTKNSPPSVILSEHRRP